MSTLLDTNVLSELLRQQPAPPVLEWMARQPSAALWVSAVTQAEMLLGGRLLPAGRRRAALERALQAMFAEEFADRVAPFDAAAAGIYADLVAARREQGRPISQFDAQIAAIARSRRFRLATRNLSYFEGCGVALVDPWAGGAA